MKHPRDYSTRGNKNASFNVFALDRNSKDLTARASIALRLKQNARYFEDSVNKCIPIDEKYLMLNNTSLQYQIFKCLVAKNNQTVVRVL